MGAWLLVRNGEPPAPATEVRVPESTGITVEVLNGSGRQGLARVVTRILRAEGFDVMFFGTAREEVATSEVILRRGDSAAVRRVAEAVGISRVRIGLDTLLRIDVTVLLGADYRPDPD